MTDPRATDPHATDAAPETFGDLPIQPTGSGVADLEVAYEQMRLADEAEAGPDDAALTPTETGIDLADSEAHPS